MEETSQSFHLLFSTWKFWQVPLQLFVGDSARLPPAVRSILSQSSSQHSKYYLPPSYHHNISQGDMTWTERWVVLTILNRFIARTVRIVCNINDTGCCGRVAMCAGAIVSGNQSQPLLWVVPSQSSDKSIIAEGRKEEGLPAWMPTKNWWKNPEKPQLREFCVGHLLSWHWTAL